jgi:transcriptional regulator with XRE-family HTH domain
MARAYANDMSRDDLAARLGISEGTLRKIEAGTRGVGPLELPGYVQGLSAATGVPEDFFTVADPFDYGPHGGTGGGTPMEHALAEVLPGFREALEKFKNRLREGAEDDFRQAQ